MVTVSYETPETLRSVICPLRLAPGGAGLGGPARRRTKMRPAGPIISPLGCNRFRAAFGCQGDCGSAERRWVRQQRDDLEQPLRTTTPVTALTTSWDQTAR